MEKQYKCCIVDDEPIARRVVSGYLNPLPDYTLVRDFGDAFEAMHFVKQNQIDLLFLDIKMPGITGLDFLRGLSNPPKVILITAFRDYALEGFELNVVDYLLKPVSQARFLQALSKFEARVKPASLAAPAAEKKNLLVKVERRHVKVELQKILFVESKGDYVHIHTTSDSLKSNINLSALIQELPGYFLQTHRSFVVNTQHLKSFSKEEIQLDGKVIPIGRKYKAMVLQRLMPQ